MRSEKKSLPVDPAALPQVRLERADASILRLELERGEAQQGVEAALESDDPARIVLAQGRASEVAEALTTAQAHRERIAAELEQAERERRLTRLRTPTGDTA